LPTTLPKVIAPPGGVPNAPNDSILIQIGFEYGLNYPFVVESGTAVAQIFSYLPEGIAHGIYIEPQVVVMQYLQPYNTLGSLGYIKTLAMAYIPRNMVSPLQLGLTNPNSAIYNHPNPSVKTLMSMIDPSIPVLADQNPGGGSPPNGDGASSAGTDGNGQGAPIGSDEDSSAPVRPSSVAVAVGAVAGAAIYGAAMFLVARRYKKKRAAHQRSSSMMDSGEPRAVGEDSALMTGGRRSAGHGGWRSTTPPDAQGRDSRNSGRTGGSGRTYISPPVMAENSLGWN
jgi:hypothetical protein